MNELKNQNLGESRVPPPPPPPIGIRTMESDIKSIRETSGGSPAPIEPAVPQPPAAPASPEKEAVKITLPGYGGPEETVFEPEGVIPPQTAAVPLSSSKKQIIIAAAAVLAAIGAGAAVYFFVLPVFSPLSPPAAPQPPSPPVASESQQVVKPLVHKSFLIVPADLSEEVKIETPATADFSAALNKSAQDNRPAGVLKEIVITGPDGPLSFAGLTSVLFPDLKIGNLFEDDFTALLYYDEKGVWPVFAAKPRLGETETAKTAAKNLETSANLKDLFLKDPGEMTKEGFRDGKIGNFTSVRYALFSGGSALNYGFFNDYFIIGASYAGLGETVKRLGL